jgi:RHS repeat-associated protein
MGYLSADSVLDDADQSQGYLNNQTVMLAPGASYTVTKSFTTTTATAPGTYTFIVKADGHNLAYTASPNTDGGNLVEANEANNTTSATVTLNRPDLTIGPLTIGTIVANPNGSFTIPVTYTVTNTGAAITPGSWYDLGYLSSDGVLDNADQSQGFLNNQTVMLVPGASYTLTRSFTTTTTTAPGTYTFIVKADGHNPAFTGGSNTDTGNLVEASDANNTAAAMVTLNRPDLAVGPITLGTPTQNSSGGFSIPVTYTVTNVGSVATGGNWYDMAYLSADGVLDDADQSQGFLNNQTVMLAPGASYTLTKTFTTSTTTGSGTYTFFVKADGHNAAFTGGSNTDGGNLVETNEANNTASAPLTLIVKVATSTTLTSSLNPLQAGQSSTLTATVSPPEATGAITFKDNGNVLASAPVSGGRATYVAVFGSAGSHSLTAEYGGDTYRLSSSSAALVQTVTAFNSRLTLAVTPQVAFTNRATTLTATVSSAQGGGTVTFRDGVNTLATLLVKGSTVTYYPTLATAGTHSLSAVYSGDANNTSATSNTVALTVNAPTMPTGALVRQFGYDNNGNCQWETDPNGNRTDHAFDGLNRPKSDTGPAPMAGSARPVVSYGRNAADDLTSVSDPRSLATAYTVDGLGNRKATNSPDAGQGSATYDVAGRLATRTDARGKLTRFSYDAIDRLTRIDYASGTPTVFEYDGGTTPQPTSVGRLTKITDESGTTAYAYDGFGHVLTKTQVTGSGSTAKTFTVSYAWGTSGGATGKLVSITYPTGSRVNYTYTVTGRLSAITLNPVNANGVGTNTAVTVPVLNTVGYSGANDVLSWTWGNGTAYRRTIDSFGRLTSLPLGNPSGTGAAAGLLRTLQYDNGRNILALRHTQAGVAQPLLDQSFVYDALDRLTDATVAGTHYGYAYDLNGNRTTRVIGSTSYTSTVAATSNRLLQVQAPGTNGATQTGTWVHDAAGNLTGDGSMSFAYSDRGRLKSATVSGGTVSYLYNGLEQRVSKTAAKTLLPTGGAFYVHDEQGRLLGEYDADGLPIHETVWLGDLPVAVLKQAGTAKQGSLQVQVYDVYADHLATPRVITRSTDQAIVWRWDGAEPFGATGPDENPKGLGVFRFDQRFPGQVFDAETGVVQNWHREYRPGGGRYLETDPIGLAGGINAYVYVEGQPLTYSDASGLVKHTTGRTVDCGKGCSMRIDFTFDERTGVRRRHLHWECKGKSGVCGEDGDASHGGSWDDVPEQIKECARRHGFNGVPRSSDRTWKYVVGAVVIVGGLVLLPEITVPTVAIGAFAH